MTANRRFLIAAALVLAVAMGIGRFAYTPLLPVMERDAGLSVAGAGALAFWNLLGYLAGSSLAMLPVMHGPRLTIVRASLAGVVLTTALMALPSPFWIPLRFMTGACSGFALIFASSIVLDRAARHGRADWPPYYFAGVGIGIAFTGIAVPVFVSHGGSHAAWIGLAIVAALALGFTASWFVDDGPRPQRTAGSAREGKRAPSFAWLLAAYAIEGFAYVIPATFLVAIVAATPALAPFSAAAWIVVGLSGAVATFGWIVAGARFGKGRALGVALLLQTLGVFALALSRSPVAVLFGAVALGGTFMAITLFATAIGRDFFPSSAASAISRLTMLYAIGQMIGPLAATALAVRFGSYVPALLASGAGAALSASIAFLLVRTPPTVTRATSA